MWMNVCETKCGAHNTLEHALDENPWLKRGKNLKLARQNGLDFLVHKSVSCRIGTGPAPMKANGDYPSGC